MSQTTSNIWIFGVASLVLLAAGGAVYYLILRRQRTTVKAKAGSAPGSHPLLKPEVKTSAKTSASEPATRYVWDDRKLAWVENTQPADVKRSEAALEQGKATKTSPSGKSPETKTPPSRKKRAARYPRRDV